MPSTQGLDSYVLQVGANRAETARIWDVAAADPGDQPLRRAERRSANILATTPGPDAEPLMLSMERGKGRSIAYGGDTWVWARSSEEGRLAHRKFWRQIIFWLSHKENDGDNQVKLTLDRRRVAVGEKVELSATARDAKGAAIPNVSYETKVEREGPDPSPEPVELYNQGDEARARSTPPRRSASPAITRSPSSPAATARKSAATRPGSSSTRTTASSKTPPPTSNWPARSPRSPTASRSLPRTAGQLPQGNRPVGLHRIPQPLRVQGLGQLAVPPDLHRPAHPRMVAAQAPRLGLRAVRDRVNLSCRTLENPDADVILACRTATDLMIYNSPHAPSLIRRSSPTVIG